jgi:hypothetical protein
MNGKSLSECTRERLQKRKDKYRLFRKIEVVSNVNISILTIILSYSVLCFISQGRQTVINSNLSFFSLILAFVYQQISLFCFIIFNVNNI